MHITEITPKIAQKAEKIRLAPYCRVSSDSADQMHSFATQIRYYSDYAKKNPQYEIVDIYADEGITGTELDKRDEMNRLLRDCKRGKIDRIITKSVSRFARNTEELLVTLRMLKELGVSVYFEEQGIDTAQLNMEMIITFPGMAAQQESETISGNVRWGVRKRMESGEFVISNPPYGYTLVDKKMVVNEAEAIIVRRIFALFLQGMGKQSIANLLNEEGVPRRNGYTVWHMTAIHYILTNEKYMGDKIPKTRKYINGTPTILINDGKLYRKNLKQAKLDLSEFMLLCREHGYFDLDEIQTAIFEHNGKLSILPKAANRPVTPEDLKITAKATHIGVEVIMDGRVMGENLSRVGRDENWLTKQLKAQGHKDVNTIFLGVYRPEEDKLTIYPNE